MDWEERLANLESLLAFQDRTIEQLNQVVIDQEARVAALESQLKLVLDQLHKAARLVRDIDDEELPPHY